MAQVGKGKCRSLVASLTRDDSGGNSPPFDKFRTLRHKVRAEATKTNRSLAPAGRGWPVAARIKKTAATD
ncbi:MAG: hypothetical protein A3F68_06250 [Acidobacteria bacterium RIFCSPLOWO2_12_FULL_54_10]|nr:MAG: hypothetical protein A3F68_06250 [Acidobacteria bacterium RIFCSPLOWO2_12_FULL_54_10]